MYAASGPAGGRGLGQGGSGDRGKPGKICWLGALAKRTPSPQLTAHTSRGVPDCSPPFMFAFTWTGVRRPLTGEHSAIVYIPSVLWFRVWSGGPQKIFGSNCKTGL